MSSKPLIVYLAARGFERDLVDELALNGVQVREVKERLVLADGLFRSAWAQNIWLEPFFQPIASVGEAVRTLKSIQRNWKLHAVDFHRRAALIEQQLPPVKAKPLAFGTPAPTSPLGSWTLWDRDTLLVSAKCSSAFADGEVNFEEDKVNPPSRAYLKLWETFTLLGQGRSPVSSASTSVRPRAVGHGCSPAWAHACTASTRPPLMRAWRPCRAWTTISAPASGSIPGKRGVWTGSSPIWPATPSACWAR